MTINAFQMPAALNIDSDTRTPLYGKFWAQPFERGWGLTVGNAMRRVLLSSIEGAAFTSIKISGVLHEFYTIPGIKEDVTHILLNIKSIPVKMHSETPKTLYVKKQGQGVLLSGDIEADADVEIMDPNIHIATLDDDGDIEMWLRVKMGKGFVSAESNREDELDIGFQPIDSVHSPVRKVNYQVFPARVGRVTTYERLVLEVWTNGTYDPVESVQMAASLLQSHMDIFTSTPEELSESEAVSPAFSVDIVETEVVEEDVVLTRSVEELDIPSRIINNLKKVEILTIRELLKKTPEEILKTDNFGKKSVLEIERALTEMGLSLANKEEREKKGEEQDKEKGEEK